MSNSQPPSGSIDKDHLYGRYQRTEDWQDDLSRKTAHKALDIPVDDMNVNVKKGLDTKGLAVVGATIATTVVGSVLGVAWLFTGNQPLPLPAPLPAATDTDTTRAIQVDVGKYTPPENDDG